MPRNWAFLSYSHQDRKWAAWLHCALGSIRQSGVEAAAGAASSSISPIVLAVSLALGAAFAFGLRTLVSRRD